ncbi:hypothetical protein [Paenibacillus sp. NEAU-GSW1]|uniref:hypothetical protein n=1 Tax=Paenibacillus sp. NEAU-GSW1 TaxID=2682486 RepID=UPI0012E2DB2B|nr:hypothetical protein [Paenibacillus sp. NEAU-GSW1]MUT68722.1 hypothetical protein [Paenibacillus sp. NEAU-GSW1]
MMKKMTIVMLLTALAASGCSNGDSNEAETPPPTAAATVQTSAEQPSPTLSEEPAASPITTADFAAELKKGIFGFANSDGSKLISDGTTENTNNGLVAIGEMGRVIPVAYAGEQARTEKDNGRQTSQNFENMKGTLYSASQGSAKKNSTYFIIDSAIMSETMLLPLQVTDPKPAEPAVQEEIEKAKGRSVEHAWPLATIGDQTTVYLVEFVRSGDDMLASLAFLGGDQWTFYDYPATYDPNSTWRVDDGGVITPDQFQFLFAASASDDGFVIGVQWLGAEGESVSLLSIASGKATELDNRYGRYMSPL